LQKLRILVNKTLASASTYWYALTLFENSLYPATLRFGRKLFHRSRATIVATTICTTSEFSRNRQCGFHYALCLGMTKWCRSRSFEGGSPPFGAAFRGHEEDGINRPKLALPSPKALVLHLRPIYGVAW